VRRNNGHCIEKNMKNKELLCGAQKLWFFEFFFASSAMVSWLLDEPKATE